MAQPLLVPFICSKCHRELAWASVTANVFCPVCRCWIRPSGEVVRNLRIGSVKLPDVEYGQLNLFSAEKQ